MYKFLIPVIAIALCVVSCTKNAENSCPVVMATAPASQVDTLKRYLDSIGVTAVKDPRGFYYNIVDSGVGARPNSCSAVTVNYKGSLANDSVFDSNHNTSFVLNQVISGWQESIPLIRNGGVIKIYLPPALAYGTSGTTNIPGNSILKFDIQLVSVR